MTRDSLRRSEEQAYVVAAKNLGAIYAAMGGKKSEFLESHAKRHGFTCWNAYREAGKVSLTYRMADGDRIVFRPGYTFVKSTVFDKVARTVMQQAQREGYTCDASAPIVISENVEGFLSYGRMGGLALRSGYGNRSFKLIENISGPAVIDIVISNLTGRSGVILIDLAGIGEKSVKSLREACPNAIIFCHSPSVEMGDADSHFTEFGNNNDVLRFSESHKREGARDHLEVSPGPDRVPLPDSVKAVLIPMLRAFARSGEVFDTMDLPSIKSMSVDHEAMVRYRSTFPEYNGYEFNGASLAPTIFNQMVSQV